MNKNNDRRLVVNARHFPILKLLFILHTALLFTPALVKCQGKDSIQLYISKAVALFQKESLYSENINWKKMQDSLTLLSAKMTSYKQADEVLIWVFSKLKDKHGFISTKDTSYKYKEPVVDRLSAGIKEEYTKPRSIKISMLTTETGYYKMPAVLIGSDKLRMKEWANKLRDSLCKLLSYHPKGLIIDLRMNNGGNSAPMLEAFKIILGDAYKIYYADKNLVLSDPAKNEDTAAASYRKCAVPDNNCNFFSGTPLAVLIGPATASSGEILAMALASRPDTKLFGEPTSGNCNSTNGFRTGINSFYALLTVSYVADHRKKINKQSVVVPDVYVKSDDNYNNLNDDITVRAAQDWLKINYGLR